MSVRAEWPARVAAALLALALISRGAPARADEAEQHFQRGVDLYSEADYRSALLEFKRAYEIDPKWQVLYNIALSDYQLLDYAGALTAYERYKNEGKGELSPARRVEVDREIEKLRTRVAKLTVVVNVDGAKVTIDDAPAGVSPFREPILVSAGRRRVGVTAPGRAPSNTTIDFVGGDAKKVSLVLEPAASVPLPPVAAVAAPPPPAEPPKRSFPWIGWAATSVFAIGAGVTGGLALSASSDLDSKLATLHVKQGDIDSAHSKTVALGVVTDALLGAAVVSGGISLYFTLRAPSADAATSGRVRVTPLPGGGRAEVTF